MGKLKSLSNVAYFPARMPRDSFDSLLRHDYRASPKIVQLTEWFKFTQQLTLPFRQLLDSNWCKFVEVGLVHRGLVRKILGEEKLSDDACSL
ncbi:hypothetical protein [Piscinibacter sp. XHJ-5]|uniref:hypothetical protein n=1 Tax=Piscinibacter sp. XHJ-5 TaxID=3037797 RepID=UPI002452CE11|nr:hypothetical protein [Piscinibacter sp. XHJ-5]